MARNAAEQHPEIDARRHWLVRPNRNGGKTDVVGVLQHAKAAAAVEGNVEFTRQAVEFAVVQNVVIQLASQWAGVDQPPRVDPGGRAAGQYEYYRRRHP